MATMKQVAELAGVSTAAVSRYLNGGYISSDKAERIKAAIADTGYVRSNQARALRTGSTHVVGVIVPKIDSESMSRATAGISQVLRERGYQMLLASTSNHAERELEYLELFQNHPVDGIILAATLITPAHRAAFSEVKVPLVLLGQQVEGACCVFHDDAGAAYDLGRAVGKLAHGDVGYIGVDRADAAAGAAREDGFAAGLESVGAVLDSANRRMGAFTVDSGYACARDLLRANPALDRIACATDTMAAGAIRALDETLGAGEGARRVSGFGDNAFLRSITGGIPTVHFGYLTSGIESATMLLDRIADPSLAARQVKLGYSLMLP